MCAKDGEGMDEPSKSHRTDGTAGYREIAKRIASLQERLTNVRHHVERLRASPASPPEDTPARVAEVKHKRAHHQGDVQGFMARLEQRQADEARRGTTATTNQP
jgi:hypothetical protein